MLGEVLRLGRVVAVDAPAEQAAPADDLQRAALASPQLALAGEPPRQDLQEVRGRAASARSLPSCCAYCGWPPPRGDERGEQEDAPHAAFTVRRGRAGVAFASLVADDAYRGCNACVASLLLRGPLGAALQASDETKRGRTSACSNDARCRLQRSEHDAYAYA